MLAEAFMGSFFVKRIGKKEKKKTEKGQKFARKREKIQVGFVPEKHYQKKKP